MSARRQGEKSGVVIRRESGLPIYRQLVDQLRYLIAAGRFRSGEYLPTMRELAGELGLNLNTVYRAYQQLQRDGLIHSTPGKGATVTAPAPHAHRAGGAEPAASPEQVDAILSAALERAIAAGLSPADLAARIAGLLDDLARRVPPPPRVRVAAGPAWRGLALSKKLASLTGLDVAAFSEGEAEPGGEGGGPARLELVVRPRYGEWLPEAPPAGGAEPLDLAVLPDRSAVRSLVGLEPGSAVCAVAADEAVARWILDAAVTFASPGAARWTVADRAEGLAIRDGEWALVEEGLPGAETLESVRSVAIDVTFPPTAAELLGAAIAARR